MGKNAKRNPSVQKQQKNNPSHNKAQGRKSGNAGAPKQAVREKNVGHKKAEEHNKSQQHKHGSGPKR
jgi:hypothetical protein